MRETSTPVLIAGGALAGLSSAVFLAHHGVPCMVVERHRDILDHPRVRGLNRRCMELYRSVGLEEAIIEANPRASALNAVRQWLTVRARTLADPDVHWSEQRERHEENDISPAQRAPIDQDLLERILRARAEDRGVDVRFGTELVDFTQRGAGVEARILDRATGEVSAVRCRYLLGCDGYRSPVRQRLLIPVDGPGALMRRITFVFEADLRPALRGRPVNLCYVDEPVPGTSLMAYDGARRWVFSMPRDPSDETPAEESADRCVDLVRAAVGVDDLEVTVCPQSAGGQATVLEFEIGAQLARRLSEGRVFLVGDAAHVMPPMGAFGASSGIQDAYNLAWKLAAVLCGTATEKLLATYHAERHPVDELALGQAMVHLQERTDTTAAGGSVTLDRDAVVFGCRYRSTAVLSAPGSPTDPVPATELAAQPGTRAPHCRIVRAGVEQSMLDLFGRNFVLLLGPEAGCRSAQVDALPAEFRSWLDVYRIGTDITDLDDQWPSRYGPAPATILVRPDGIVAWRSDEKTGTLTAVLSQVLATG